MKNLKKFATTADYNAFKNSTGMTYPLTSYIENTRETKFDHWIPNDGTMIVVDDYSAEEDWRIGDVSTPSKLSTFLKKNLNSQEYYSFVSELIYNGHYYWLWYCETDDDNITPYIITPLFNNYQHFYRHSIMYNPNDKYKVHYSELNEDLEIKYDWETIGYRGFDYDNKVLGYVKNDNYDPPVPPPITTSKIYKCSNGS